MGIGSGKNRQKQIILIIEEEEEEWDDFQRYRDNKASLSNSIFCLYHRSDQAVQPIVYYQSQPKPIMDPYYYESEHKKRNVWSVREIEHFLQHLLENPRNFWAVGKLMPQRTSKDLVFFFYAFKKLFNLKKHFKICSLKYYFMILSTQNFTPQGSKKLCDKVIFSVQNYDHFKTCQVLMSLPTQAVKKQAFQDIINEIMRPIKLHQQSFNSKSVGTWDINGAVARAYIYIIATGGHNQQYFTVEELLEIYTAQSDCRRKLRESDKNQFSLKKDSKTVQGLYPLNTFKTPQPFCKKENELKTVSYLESIEKIGSQILINQCRYLGRAEINPIILSLLKVHLNCENSEHPVQKQVCSILQPKSREENKMRKRNFSEMAMTTQFGSGKGRNLKDWVLSTSYLQSYQPASILAQPAPHYLLPSNSSQFPSQLTQHSDFGKITPQTDDGGDQGHYSGSSSPSKRLKVSNSNTSTPLQFGNGLNLSTFARKQSVVGQVSSFTSKYFEELSKVKKSLQKQEVKEEQKQKSILGEVTLTVKEELQQSDKDHVKYMESRFKHIFLNPSSSNFASNNMTSNMLSGATPKVSKQEDEEEEEGEEESGDESMKKKISQQQWNNEEKSLFLELLKKHGRDWAAIAQRIISKITSISSNLSNYSLPQHQSLEVEQHRRVLSKTYLQSESDDTLTLEY